MLGYFEYLNMPTKIGIIIAAIILFMQLIGEILEFTGKVVPEVFKIRKFFKRKQQEKLQIHKTLTEVQTLLADVNAHYSADNIAKRDAWMQWVNERAGVYDASVAELTELKDALTANNELTLDLYINVNRNRILDFASKISNEKVLVTREDFNRVFRIYNDYENILHKHGKSNGEVTIAMRIIEEAYEEHLRNHSFIEDIRGY